MLTTITGNGFVQASVAERRLCQLPTNITGGLMKTNQCRGEGRYWDSSS